MCFSRYLEKVKLTEDEKKLFFILISLPKEIDFSSTEFFTCQNVREAIDYIFSYGKVSAAILRDRARKLR